MAWEDTFKSWGSAPYVTEQQEMKNAETAVRKAIKANVRLSSVDISIIPQVNGDKSVIFTKTVS